MPLLWLEMSKHSGVDSPDGESEVAAGTIRHGPATTPMPKVSRIGKNAAFVQLPLTSQDAAWMEIALEQASRAAQLGEVPVGALVIKDGEILGSGHNRNLLDNDPTAHAEIIALRQAATRFGNHRLVGCEMVATIEPCAMCAGAMIHARLARLVYGAKDPKAGAAGSVIEVLNHPRLNHKMQITAGVLGDQCSEILKKFFQAKRSALTSRVP